MSIISLPILAVAFFLGLIGLVMSFVRSGYGIGFPIASLTVSVIGGLIAMVMGVGLVAGTSSALEEMADALKADLEMTAIPLATDTTSDPELVETAETSAPEEEPLQTDWIPSDQAALLGNKEITVENVTVGKLTVIDLFGDEGISSNQQLSIQVTIWNRTQTKKLEYKTWRGATISFGRGFATLTDTFDNIYKRINFGTGSYPSGGVQTSESIYPGDSVSDVLVFEVPVDSVELLLLELPADNIGEKGVLRFGIPAAAIEW